MHVFSGVQETPGRDCDVPNLVPVERKVKLELDGLKFYKNKIDKLVIY